MDSALEMGSFASAAFPWGEDPSPLSPSALSDDDDFADFPSMEREIFQTPTTGASHLPVVKEVPTASALDALVSLSTAFPGKIGRFNMDLATDSSKSSNKAGHCAMRPNLHCAGAPMPMSHGPDINRMESFGGSSGQSATSTTEDELHRREMWDLAMRHVLQDITTISAKLGIPPDVSIWTPHQSERWLSFKCGEHGYRWTSSGNCLPGKELLKMSAAQFEMAVPMGKALFEDLHLWWKAFTSYSRPQQQHPHGIVNGGLTAADNGIKHEWDMSMTMGQEMPNIMPKMEQNTGMEYSFDHGHHSHTHQEQQHPMNNHGAMAANMQQQAREKLQRAEIYQYHHPIPMQSGTVQMHLHPHYPYMPPASQQPLHNFGCYGPPMDNSMPGMQNQVPFIGTSIAETAQPEADSDSDTEDEEADEVLEDPSNSSHVMMQESFHPKMEIFPSTPMTFARGEGAAFPFHRSGNNVHLWIFIRELLDCPEQYGGCVRWVNRDEGTFKIESSASLARYWGCRKNRAAMNYDKLSRSLRQYYKKGIIQKPEKKQRLVYKFLPPYHLP